MEEKKRIQWSDFEPLCIIRFVLRHFWMVFLTALIAAMGLYLVQGLFMTASFNSTVTFAITSRNSASSSFSSTAATTTVASRMGELLSSDIVQNAAAKRMGLSSFPAQVSIQSPSNTNILIMDVTASSPELAYKSALAIMDCHTEYSQSVFSSVVLNNINGPTIASTANSSSSRALLLQIAAPIGAAAMIVLLIMLAIQADTIQTPTGAKHQVEGKQLATIFHERKNRTLRSVLKRRKKSLLITDPTCSFYYTETIHQLRIFIERAHDKQHAQLFLITSCSENEGKSTVAANIALSLAQKHRKVLLLDADLRKPAQSLIFEEPVESGNGFGRFLAKDFTEAELKAGVVLKRGKKNFRKVLLK